ncbi:MAG: MoaD/ThiS family protein [Spirochaetales bacterium]|nr:MoaD/ThiS family protein [Spirochaetales bacterium]
MRVHVHFFGNFRYITKRAGQDIELSESASVRDLLNFLIDEYNKMANILSPDKIKKSHVLIIKGEKPVLNYQTKIAEGDQIYLFIMLAGG